MKPHTWGRPLMAVLAGAHPRHTRHGGHSQSDPDRLGDQLRHLRVRGSQRLDPALRAGAGNRADPDPGPQHQPVPRHAVPHRDGHGDRHRSRAPRAGLPSPVSGFALLLRRLQRPQLRHRHRPLHRFRRSQCGAGGKPPGDPRASPVRRPITTAAGSASVRTATSTSRSATAAARGTTSLARPLVGNAQSDTTPAREDPAHRRQRYHPVLRSARRIPSSARRRRSGSSGSRVCAIPGDAASTARPATSTSPTSVRAPGRRSTISRLEPRRENYGWRKFEGHAVLRPARTRATRAVSRARSTPTATTTAAAPSPAATSTAARPCRACGARTSSPTTAPTRSGLSGSSMGR